MLEIYIKKGHAGVKVEIYGSMATGLAIDSSDLDILVHDFIDQNSPRFHQMSRQELIDEMQMIHEALNEVYGVRTNMLIDSASVPVIKMQMNLTSICDHPLALKHKIDQNSLDEEIKILNIDITLDEPSKSSGGIEHLGI